MSLPDRLKRRIADLKRWISARSRPTGAEIPFEQILIRS